MRLVVDSIPHGGREIAIRLDLPWAVEAAQEVLEVPPVTLEGSLLVRARRVKVTVTGALKAAGARVCERCGEEVVLTLDTRADLVYVPDPAESESESEVEIRESDLDEGWYTEGGLDMGQVVSEALALALPPRILCEDTQACDDRLQALLNEQDVDEETGHPAFAALKGMH